MKKRIFSGAQPTGKLHLGNYLGAIKSWVNLQDDYENFFCIVNLHAITVAQDPTELRKKTIELAKIYLAAGIDPKKSTIFVQSDVSQHAELAWVLNCIARMGELERMTQFKDKSKDGVERSTVGLFSYPILMASDILLYMTNLVPVGSDQKQHLELTRDISERFNRDYGETFVIPEPYIPTVGARIMSLKDPSKKMSKSDDNENASIFLLDDAETVNRKVKKAVTDSGTEIVFDANRPAITNLLTIYQLLSNKTADECLIHFSNKGYGDLKRELSEQVIETLESFQKSLREFDDQRVEKILADGAVRARKVASKTLSTVYSRIGLQ